MSEDAGCAERFLRALFATVVKPISDLRLLISGLCALLLALSFPVEAQQTAKMRRIGLLLPNTPEIVARSPRIQAFFQGLQDFGWIEGQNFTVERRFAEGHPSGLADLAIELASLKVDVIVTAAAPSAQSCEGCDRHDSNRHLGPR